MRRPGRRIEIWEVNTASGEARVKPKRGRPYWRPVDVVEVEVKLDSASSPPRFFVYPGDRPARSFADLESARIWIRELTTELADARVEGEDWREVVLVGGYYRVKGEEAFDTSFHRALVVGNRARLWTGDAYGPTESIQRLHASAEIPFSDALWAEIREFVRLDAWLEDRLAGRDLELDEGNEDDDPGDPARRVPTEFRLRHWRGRARLIRDLRDGTSARVPRDPSEELRRRVVELERSAAMACENPLPGCDCAGCRLAVEAHEGG
jgi:hypothetical protein